MMKIIGQLKDVQAFSIEKGIELIHFKNNSILLNNEYLTEDAPYYSFSDNYIFLTKSDNSIIKYDFKKKIMLSHDDSYYPVGDTKNNEYLRSSDDEYDKNNNCFWGKTNIISKDTNKIIFTTKNKYTFWNSIWLGDNYIYTSPLNRGILNNLEIKTETTLWQYAITDLGAEKVSKILGVFGQTLVVACGYSRLVEMPNGNKVNAKLEKIIGLEVNSGHLLYETDHYLINRETHFLGSGLNTNWVFNDEETIIHAILDDYLSFDTQTGKITALNIREMAQEKGINGLQSSSIEENKIGFRAFDDQLGGFQAVIGIFNTQTLKIEDHYTYADARKEGAYFKPGQPIISGKKIYALDSKNTLHILERE